MLIDRAKIHIKAGNGGDGCTSFYRDRFVRKGKPNGGRGGHGGNIIFKVDKNVHTLLDFQHKRHFKAARGAHGSSNNKKGKDGNDLLIGVPPGTVIKDISTGFILRDLTGDTEKVVVASGGAGGKGNSKDRDATPGAPGEEKDLALELKFIADVGIIGYPNAGKSTLISRISRAKSKIAPYRFTTRAPVLGMVRMENADLIFADMPGLIEDAHKGRGLGDEFLRHIERTKILLHMVDMAEIESRPAYEDYLSINKELSLYGRRLAEKPQVLACNKMDLPEAKKNFKVFKKKTGAKAFPISAKTGEGVEKLLEEIWKMLVA